MTIHVLFYILLAIGIAAGAYAVIDAIKGSK